LREGKLHDLNGIWHHSERTFMRERGVPNNLIDSLDRVSDEQM
jgi:hypothetical protein